MCLGIDHKYHPKVFVHGDSTKGAAVAKHDIVVWKMLSSERYCTINKAYMAESPYRGFDYTFGKLTRPANGFTAEFCGYTGVGDVDYGLHAFYQKNSERVALIRRRYAAKMYPAVIPKGSKFYMGHRGEIASDQLIVFRNRRELLKAYGAEKYGTPVDRKVYSQV